MKKGLFEFTIVSPYDRERLTCEISYQSEILAEISQETEKFLLELYPSQNNKWWKIPLGDFQEALEVGKKFLVEGEPPFI